mgnify:FL=1
MKKSKKLIAIFSALIIITYMIWAIFLLVSRSSETYIVRQGTLTQEDEAVGYIIRDEKVEKGEDYENGIYEIATENQRVAVGNSIFRYYSDSEKEITEQVEEINKQIQEILEQENEVTSADIKAIESQIEEKIEHINTINNYQEIVEDKKNIDELISKKINFIGDVTENKDIKKLVKDRKALEEKLKSGSKYQKAQMSGIVSYRVDGLEETLTPEKFNDINEKLLNSLDIKTGEIISTSDECGKVIDNFKCYVVVTLNSKQAMEAKVNDSLKLRISNEETKAKIVQINEENNKRTIIFQINKMTEDLIKHRKVLVDVIWWNDSGLKVPNSTLTKEGNLYYVVRNKAGVQNKILVKIIKQTENYSIIDSYTEQELQELGFSQQEIKNYKKITNYDEIEIKK